MSDAMLPDIDNTAIINDHAIAVNTIEDI